MLIIALAAAYHNAINIVHLYNKGAWTHARQSLDIVQLYQQCGYMHDSLLISCSSISSVDTCTTVS